jgi:hypothetical protein
MRAPPPFSSDATTQAGHHAAAGNRKGTLCIKKLDNPH